MTPRRRSMGRALSHVEPGGRSARMVDVGAKPVTARSASARARIVFPRGVLSRVLAGAGPKGPIAETARAAGILAAKQTSHLIPMCHGLALDHVEIAFEVAGEDALDVECRAACRGRTGVEMEALVGAALASLTVYDMTKAAGHGIRIESLELVEKRGGRSGTWKRPAQGATAPRAMNTAQGATAPRMNKGTRRKGAREERT